MRAAQVLCDRCGQPIAKLGDAVLAIASDALGRAVGLTLDHAQCADQRRDGLRDEETLQAIPAGDLRADRLRQVARAHWASATRILAKVKRLVGQRPTPPDGRKWHAPGASS